MSVADPAPFGSAYDNGDFSTVVDLATVQSATTLGTGIAMVNCQIVFVGS